MKKKVLVIGILVMLLGVTVLIKPKKEILIDITNENNKLALFVENEEGIYEEATTIPSSGYTLNTSRSGCNNGAKPSWNLSDNTLKISSLEKNSTSCYLYFRKANAIDKILANVTVQDSPDSFTDVATTDEGVFKAQDDDGDTYYWRGAVENNYVKFANKFWRIIRINGDGSIRMIYDGETARANGTSSTDSQIGTSAFNSSYNNNKYVGFKYTDNDVHGTGTNSTILDTLNTWYANNLKSYEDKIDPNSGFCNDRDPYTNASGTTSGGGTGTTKTYYGASIRMLNSSGSWNSTQTPTFKCKNSSDLFTKSGAVKKDGTANGNRALTNPIGLITADEVVYAGGFGGTRNQSHYLYTGQTYWTMSPLFFSNSAAQEFYVYSDGLLNGPTVNIAYDVRPVINLSSDVELTGTGSMSDPYVVVGGN